jgi:hypothetical protein
MQLGRPRSRQHEQHTIDEHKKSASKACGVERHRNKAPKLGRPQRSPQMKGVPHGHTGKGGGYDGEDQKKDGFPTRS